MAAKRNQYLHGYSAEEQKRLLKQAKFLEPWVYPGVNLEKCKNVLEVGCGVGAQTSILLKRFPRTKFTGVDISSDQLLVAHERLRREVKTGRVELVHADATNLPLEDRTYDGAFICWFLEHVPDPLRVLKEVRKKLRPGSPIFISEVFNSTLFVDPYSPALLRYWFAFNDYQWTIQGHPFVGVQLGNLLKAAKYRKIQTELRPFYFDSRDVRGRKAMIAYTKELLLSAAPGLIKTGRVSHSLVRSMNKELNELQRSRDSLFFYAWFRAVAYA